MGKFGETRGGVEKSGVLEHKSGNISETRKYSGKVTVKTYRKSPGLFRKVPFPTPLRPSLPQDWGSQPPKRQSLLSQERVKLRPSNLAGVFTGSIRTRAHSKFWRKRSLGISRDCPIFWVFPIISWRGKATNLKFCSHIHRIDRNKSPLKISGKVVVGVLRDSRKFLGHHI